MAVAKLIITDIDLDTGQVTIDCEIDGSMTDDGHMTAAEVMIRVIHAEVTSPAFKQRVWNEVNKMVEGREGVTVANDTMDPAKEVAAG